jgi:predicted Zn-dependent protease
MLSQPTRSPQARVQALIYLSSVLARYHRFADTILVQEHLLEHVLMDEGTSHALRLGRAMAMLREDHLFDADRAISELRRSPLGEQSAGLALVEIYRDVKTGHPAEAVEIFDAKLPAMRQQLGHRIADAYALVAQAYDLLGNETQAARAYENATLLAPAGELQRRYPEMAPLTEKYQPAPAPAEAA